MSQEKLSPDERVEFEKLKRIIDDGIQSFWVTAQAISRVKEAKLYREDYATFDDFVRRYYGIGRSQAYRVIEAWEVNQELEHDEVQEQKDSGGKISQKPNEQPTEMSPTGDKSKVYLTNERQARELAKAPPGTRKQVFDQVAQNGPVTAKAIAAVVETKPWLPPEEQAPVKPVLLLDKIGREIPHDARADWDRIQVIQDMLTDLSQLKSRVMKAIEDQDPFFREANSSTIQVEFKNLHTELKRAKPFAVCPYCQGHAVQAKCSFCCGRGWVSEFKWSMTVPVELKQMCQRQAEQLKERNER